MNPEMLDWVSAQRLRRDLFHLCSDPLRYRKANYTRPGQTSDSLAEADDYIRGQLEAAGYTVAATMHQVQAFRCDETKPLHHWYATPDPTDPWYEVANLEAARLGSDQPDEIIQLIAHKDSMSWIDSPGAHDNAVGTAANLELARALAAVGTKRTVRFLFCNEEHTPWTRGAAAMAAASRGDKIIATLNVDSLAGKSDEGAALGRHTHIVAYSTDEGRPLAEFIASCATRLKLDLDVRLVFKERVNDDDGMFIEAGYRTTVMNVGSWPYGDSQYHLAGDVAERVDIENVRLRTQLLLAALLAIDGHGARVFDPSSW